VGALEFRLQPVLPHKLKLGLQLQRADLEIGVPQLNPNNQPDTGRAMPGAAKARGTFDKIFQGVTGSNNAIRPCVKGRQEFFCFKTKGCGRSARITGGRIFPKKTTEPVNKPMKKRNGMQNENKPEALLNVEELEERIAPSATGQLGYEGQPGNQGNGLRGYEGQPGNQGGGNHHP
jgi:hypothetical protein